MGRGLESFVERFVGRVHMEICAQDDQRVARGANDGFGVVASDFGFPLGAFEIVDVGLDFVAWFFCLPGRH